MTDAGVSPARRRFCERVWPDMVALYGEPGVGDLCLGLQAAFDLDVTCFLFLALADHAGEGLGAADAERLAAVAAAWRALAVRPLRTVRIGLRERCTTAEETAFRRMIQQAELQAERLETARLALHFAPLSGPTGLAAPYLAAAGLPAATAAAALAEIRQALAGMAARGDAVADAPARPPTPAS